MLTHVQRELSIANEPGELVVTLLTLRRQLF